MSLIDIYLIYLHFEDEVTDPELKNFPQQYIEINEGAAIHTKLCSYSYDIFLIPIYIAKCYSAQP